jgi:glycosyltransferase involved in cell wall biosynthesis
LDQLSRAEIPNQGAVANSTFGQTTISMKERAMKNPDISIVVPVFNEAENIRPLYDAVGAAMRQTNYTWEAVFIDDGSSDGTYKALEELHSDGGNVDIVRLRRNFGQTAAMAAGLDHASGEVIVLLDGDLQNDPRDIPLLVSNATGREDYRRLRSCEWLAYQSTRRFWTMLFFKSC